MKNGDLNQFLDTGWFTEATLFYNGYIYWHEGQYENNEIVFYIDRWKAQNEDNLYYHSITSPDGTLFWERVLEIHGSDMDIIKKQFLESQCYEGKSFWQIEKELVWLDESAPITE